MEWNEDKSKATLTKEEYEELKGKADKSTEQFNAGYAKGREKEREEINSVLTEYDIDAKDLSGSLKNKMQLLNDIENGKYPKELTDKFKETEAFKTLQTNLENSQKELNETKSHFSEFRKATLIDSKLKALATENKAIKPEMVTTAMKTEYTIEVTDKNELVVKDANGIEQFGEDGKPLTIEGAFKKFSDGNAYMFEANGSGGSGGGGGNDFGGVTFKDLQKDPQKKMEFIKEKGAVEYQKLVDSHDFTKKE